jgi:hypothetical protein
MGALLYTQSVMHIASCGCLELAVCKHGCDYAVSVQLSVYGRQACDTQWLNMWPLAFIACGLEAGAGAGRRVATILSMVRGQGHAQNQRPHLFHHFYNNSDVRVV